MLSRRQEMYAWAARTTVISNLGPVWYFFYGAVNAGDRYFVFELTVWRIISRMQLCNTAVGKVRFKISNHPTPR